MKEYISMLMAIDEARYRLVQRRRKRSMTRKSTSPARKSSGVRGKGRPAMRDGGVGRERILEVTAEFLSRHSLPELTTASIARAAGVDPALVRYYFGSKDALLTELVLRETARRTTEALRFLSDTAEVEERFTRRVRAVLEADAESPFYRELLGARIFNRDDAAARAVLDDLARRGRALADKLIEDGDLRRVDPAFLHMLVIGACSFFVTGRPLVSALRGKPVSGRTLDEFAEFLVDVLLHGLRPR
ncbi:MAG: TetR/AcrR family transcriptional regulator [Burkholderiaceae bacterium]